MCWGLLCGTVLMGLPVPALSQGTSTGRGASTKESTLTTSTFPEKNSFPLGLLGLLGLGGLLGFKRRRTATPGEKASSHGLPSFPADFDPETYLILNPDVRQAGFEPREHYAQHGRQEGRKYRRGGAPNAQSPSARLPSSPGLPSVPHDFDPATYLALNPDVARAGYEPREHYARYGLQESRRYR
jgi:hypothetical protein